MFRTWKYVLLFFIKSCGQAIAQPLALPEPLTKAYASIQQLRLQEGKVLLAQAEKEGMKHPALPYLHNYADLFELLITEDQALFQKRLPLLDTRLRALEQLTRDDDAQRRFYQAELRLHWAFIKLKFGQEVSASWDIIRAYRLLDENAKRFPNYLPTYKSLGLLHVLIGSIPENFLWVAKLLGLNGNIRQGIQELRRVQQKDPILNDEALLIDLLLHAYTLKLGPTQLAQLRSLPEQHPDHLLFHFFTTSVLMKEGQSQEAWRVLASVPEGNAYLRFAFLDYLRAEVLFQRGDYAQADPYYRRFLTSFKGINFTKDSYYKRFLCHWLAAPSTSQVELLEQLKTTGATVVESDQAAQRFAEAFLNRKISTSQKVLLQVRYATDGGFLERAASLLATTQEAALPLLTDKAEWNYRMGRLLQKQQKTPQAIPYLERTIRLSEGSTHYIGASAALQLGYLYRDQGRPQKASEYFKKAMQYKKHEYKNSIDNKARAALTELAEN